MDCPLCGSHLTALKQLKDRQESVALLEEQLTNCMVASQEQNCITEPVESQKCEIDNVFYDDGEFAKTWQGEICFCKVRKKERLIIGYACVVVYSCIYFMCLSLHVSNKGKNTCKKSK